jgi:Lambda phage tail tube protein, TTP
MKTAISAQNTKLYLEDLTAAPIATGVLESASASTPAYVVFDSAVNLKNGVPVYVAGSGWTSLDNQEWVIQDLDVNAKTAALYGSDCSKETAAWGTEAMYTVNAFADVCAHAYAINQTPATTIDTTTLCDTEKTFLVGFRDPGTLTFDFYLNPTDPDYLALHEAYKDGEQRMFEVVYRNGAVRTLPVIVQSINETGGVDQAVHGAATLKVTGEAILTQPTAAATPAYALTVGVTPLSGPAPLHVTMNLTEQNGAAGKFDIDWGDGTVHETLTASNTTTHNYQTAGSFTAIVAPYVSGAPSSTTSSGPAVTVS